MIRTVFGALITLVGAMLLGYALVRMGYLEVNSQMPRFLISMVLMSIGLAWFFYKPPLKAGETAQPQIFTGRQLIYGALVILGLAVAYNLYQGVTGKFDATSLQTARYVDLMDEMKAYQIQPFGEEIYNLCISTRATTEAVVSKEAKRELESLERRFATKQIPIEQLAKEVSAVTNKAGVSAVHIKGFCKEAHEKLSQLHEAKQASDNEGSAVGSTSSFVQYIVDPRPTAWYAAQGEMDRWFYWVLLLVFALFVLTGFVPNGKYAMPVRVLLFLAFTWVILWPMFKLNTGGYDLYPERDYGTTVYAATAPDPDRPRVKMRHPSETASGLISRNSVTADDLRGGKMYHLPINENGRVRINITDYTVALPGFPSCGSANGCLTPQIAGKRFLHTANAQPMEVLARIGNEGDWFPLGSSWTSETALREGIWLRINNVVPTKDNPDVAHIINNINGGFTVEVYEP